MNNRIKALIKKSFKERFLIFLPKRGIPGASKNYPLRLLSALIGYLFLVFMYYFLSIGFGELYLTGGNKSVYFSMFGVITTFMILLFQIPRIISNFFRSGDNKTLLTLPIKSNEILMGNFLGDIISDFDHVIFLATGLFVYSKFIPLDIKTVVFAIINFPLLIIIPKAILTILVLLVMRFTNVNKYSKIIKAIGYILMFAFIGGIYYVSFNQDSINFEQIGQSEVFIESANRIINIFYNTKIYGDAIASSVPRGIILSIIMWAFTLILIFLLNKLAKVFYVDSILEKEKTTSKKARSESEIDFKESSQLSLIAKHEFKNLTSDIAFISPVIIFVIIFMVIFVSAFNGAMSEDTNLLKNIGDEIYFYLFIGGIAIGAYMWTNSYIARNSLSREGNKFYIFQILPIDHKSHLLGRILGVYIINIIINAIIAIVFSIFVPVGVLGGLMVFLGFSIGSIVVCIVNGYLGTFNINTEWTKPAELNRKRGFRYFIESIVTFLAIGIIGGVTVWTYVLTGNNKITAITLLLVILAIVCVLFFNLGLKRYRKGFRDV